MSQPDNIAETQNKTMNMLRELTAFYESQGISPANFRCRHCRECSDEATNFTEAKASHVGPRYGLEDLPRLLFLSLDSGSACPHPQERTAEAVRRQNLAMCVECLPKNKHWYCTHELAFHLLHQFKADLTLPDTRLYFAHVNSAKCCQNNSGRREASHILFDNCRKFIPGELGVLMPDIIVTQGKQAEKAIKHNFCISERSSLSAPVAGYKLKARYETGLIELEPNGKKCLWLQTHHPRYGGFYPQKEHCWPKYVKKVKRFWRSQ